MLVVGRDDDEAAFHQRSFANGMSASGKSSAAVNHRRETTETTSAAGSGITLSRSPSMTPSRIPRPAREKNATYPNRYAAATVPATWIASAPASLVNDETNTTKAAPRSAHVS